MIRTMRAQGFHRFIHIRKSPRRRAVDIVRSCIHRTHEPVMTSKPRVEILYCRQCRWLLRASWMAQELLTTFSEEIGELALQPGTGGIFEVRVMLPGEEGGVLIWSRKDEGRFPEMKELKQRLRDRIAPDMALGHSDKGHSDNP
jgi:selenoprotein W-related protein